MSRIFAPMTSLLINSTQRLATCWKIVRADAVTFRFTDHDNQLTINSEVYTPVGGFSPGAKQRRDGINPNNLEIKGYIASSIITDDDLRAGKFREATVTEFVVDWRWPWENGNDGFIKNVYKVIETKWTGEYWEAQLESLVTRLRQVVGRHLNRNCDHELGDTYCAFTLAPSARTVSSITDTRRIFVVSGAAPTDLTFWEDGRVVWTSGNNNGVTSEVKHQDGTKIELHVNTPAIIQVGDAFQITEGCDRLFSTCKSKFSNGIHFGGTPHVPGNDQLLKTPLAK